MKMVFAAIAALVALSFVGCTEREDLYFKGDFCELVPRQEVFTNGVEAVIDALRPEDVLVAVNGYPLTKKMFDDIMLIKARGLSSRKGSDPGSVNNQLAEFKKKYISFFVNQRLLVDEARRLKVLAPEEIERRVNEMLRKQAKARKCTVKKVVAGFQGDFKYGLYDIAVQMLMNALIAKHIPPVTEVDDGLVKAFQDSIKEDIEAAHATNAMIRAKMMVWKGEIMSNKVSFTELAKKYNQDEDADSAVPGSWGEFERGEIEDERVRSAVFSLKVGQISNPVEDDDGFHLIRVLSVKPPERNEKGRIVQDEIRKAEHIYIPKIPILIAETDSILKADLKRQMQLQSVNAYLENLKTNGLNRIEFPHGKHLFN